MPNSSRNGAIGTNDFLQDIASAFCPDERLGVFVVMGNVGIDGRDQFWNAGEYAATQLLGRNVMEESFNHVQPRRRRRREMHGDARMPGQPRLDNGMLMRGVVVGDQVQCLVFRCFTVDFLEELQPFHMGVTLLADTDDRPVQGMHRSEQGCRSVALIVMRHIPVGGMV